MSKKFPKPKRYILKNPSKYTGNPINILSRSSWETKMMLWLDSNKQVLSWCSEETVIPYISPKDNRAHRYFIDFKAKIQANDGTVKTYIIEIKPESQIQPPKQRKNTQKYMNEVLTYGINQAKWSAATKYATDRGYVFCTLNEYDLGIAERK